METNIYPNLVGILNSRDGHTLYRLDLNMFVGNKFYGILATMDFGTLEDLILFTDTIQNQTKAIQENILCLNKKK